MSIKIDDNNYESYKRVLEIIHKHFQAEIGIVLSAHSDPILVLNNYEKQSKSIARRSLKSGLSDSISMLSDCPKSVIAAINVDLAEEKLPDLFKLRSHFLSDVKNVLRAKRIKDLDQYYVIKEILDTDTSDISAEDRDTLSVYLAEYERQSMNR